MKNKSITKKNSQPSRRASVPEHLHTGIILILWLHLSLTIPKAITTEAKGKGATTANLPRNTGFVLNFVMHLKLKAIGDPCLPN